MVKNLKHKFQSAIADGTDSTIVRPSNWNADHDFFLGVRTVTITTDTILDSDHFTLIKYTNAGTTTATLPAPAAGAMPAGWMTYIRCAVGTVNFSFTGGATINGVSSYSLRTGDVLQLISDGTPSYTGILTPANIVSSDRTLTFTAGYTFSIYSYGVITGGTVSLNPALGNYAVLNNSGAFTLVAPTVDCAIDLLILNGSTPGAITMSGFTYAANNFGDVMSTAPNLQYIMSIRRMNTFATFTIKALQ